MIVERSGGRDYTSYSCLPVLVLVLMHKVYRANAQLYVVCQSSSTVHFVVTLAKHTGLKRAWAPYRCPERLCSWHQKVQQKGINYKLSCAVYTLWNAPSSPLRPVLSHPHRPPPCRLSELCPACPEPSQFSLFLGSAYQLEPVSARCQAHTPTAFLHSQPEGRARC